MFDFGAWTHLIRLSLCNSCLSCLCTSIGHYSFSRFSFAEAFENFYVIGAEIFMQLRIISQCSHIVFRISHDAFSNTYVLVFGDCDVGM